MRITKSLALLAASVIAAGVTGASASASTATADIDGLHISQVGYNANGADAVWNRNKEYVDITATADVDVKGLVVADQWAKSKGDDNVKGCNTATVTKLPGVDENSDGELVLQAGKTVRVYSGSGTDQASGRFFLLYMDSKCGYHGHYLNNGGDTVWLVKGSNAESFTYDFDNGYYIKP